MRALCLGLCLGFLALCSSGCFVFEELDKGRAIMEAHSPKKPEEEATSAPEGEKPPTYADRVGEWFQSAKSLSPHESSGGEPLVRCTASGQTFFTKRTDCLARGGRTG